MNTEFYNWSYEESSPLVSGFSHSITPSGSGGTSYSASKDKAVKNLFVNSGVLNVVVGDAEGNTTTLTIPVSDLTDETLKNKVETILNGADADYDTLKEVGDAIKELKNTEEYSNSDIDSWFNS